MERRTWRWAVVGVSVVAGAIVLAILLILLLPAPTSAPMPTPTPTPTQTPVPTPTPTATPTPNPGEVLMQIPFLAYPCADISATVAIGEIAGLQYGDFDITYDPTILEVTGVSDGEIGGIAVPAAGNWGLIGSGEGGQGELRFSVDLVSHEAGVDGRGSLCVIRFHVPCAASTDEDTLIAFNDNELYDYNSDPMPQTWTDGLFVVRETPTPTPTATPTPSPTATATVTPTATAGATSTGGVEPTPTSTSGVEPTPTPTSGTGSTPTPTSTTEPQPTPVPDADVWVAFGRKIGTELVHSPGVGTTFEAAIGSDFIVLVNISEVHRLKVAQYDITYDPSVVEVDRVSGGWTPDVRRGRIGDKNFAVEAASFMPQETQGRVRVIHIIDGLEGKTGAGYLSRVFFHVVGAPGSTSPIEIDIETLGNYALDPISSAVTNASVLVVEPTPTPG